MASPISEVITFLQQNSLRTILQRINARDTHPLIQFIKYGICGCAALGTHILLFYLAVKYVYVELGPQTQMSHWDRALASFEPTAIILLITNALVYWLNTKWVFTPGRHSVIKEFLLFTIVNLPGAIGGFFGQAALIHFYGWKTLHAMLGFVIPNVLINFACRKFFIFKH